MAKLPSKDEFIANLGPLYITSECPICQEPFEHPEHSMVPLPCGHVVGAHCIVKCCETGTPNNSRCPECRGEFFRFERPNINHDIDEAARRDLDLNFGDDRSPELRAEQAIQRAIALAGPLQNNQGAQAGQGAQVNQRVQGDQHVQASRATRDNHGQVDEESSNEVEPFEDETDASDDETEASEMEEDGGDHEDEGDGEDAGEEQEPENGHTGLRKSS